MYKVTAVYSALSAAQYGRLPCRVIVFTVATMPQTHLNSSAPLSMAILMAGGSCGMACSHQSKILKKIHNGVVNWVSNVCGHHLDDDLVYTELIAHQVQSHAGLRGADLVCAPLTVRGLRTAGLVCAPLIVRGLRTAGLVCVPFILCGAAEDAFDFLFSSSTSCSMEGNEKLSKSSSSCLSRSSRAVSRSSSCLFWNP